MNYDYPEADHATRETIAKAHEAWQRGLIWTLQNHPRVPEKVRKYYAKWGLPNDEFTDNAHWSRQLYIREARRMLGETIATEPTVRDDRGVTRSIAMGAYAMDSHNVQRYVDSSGHVRNEGDVQSPVKRPYRIEYGTIVPKAGQCDNLLVPVCLSASHIAYGSIRMEPVFMALGQSAGAAACLAIGGKTTVQEVSYDKLKERLLADKQVLEWKPAETSQAKEATPAPVGPARVVCFGDSITAKGYPAVLAKMLGVDVANAGVNGNTTAQGLRRMSKDVLARKPEVVVILFGTNDTRVDAPKVHVPVERYAANLAEMIDTCRAAGAKVIVCTIPPIDPARYFTRHDKSAFDQAGGLDALLKQYREAATRTANERNVPVVDLANALTAAGSSWSTLDGVHPTETANRTLAQLIADAVNPLLRK
jgi:lysophospholipase L1-like esterase